MLGTRISCPHCNHHFLVNSMPADPAQSPAPSSAPAQPAAPAISASSSSAKPIAAAMVDRSGADAYDLRPDDEPVATPKRPQQVARPSTPLRTNSAGYDMKPDPAPVTKPAKPAAQSALIPAAAPAQPQRKGLLARLFGRSK